MNIGIVGSEAAKFTMETERTARGAIETLLLSHIAQSSTPPVVLSGGCHLGGIDIWAKQEGEKLGLTVREYLPRVLNWELGYKPRNTQIAANSTILYNITVKDYPIDYRGQMRFQECYHCHTSSHVKSGGCWTARLAVKLGKVAKLIVIDGTGYSMEDVKI